MGRKGGSKRPRACGVLLVDKPLGVTSHDVVGWARRELNERAIGHCGTLDPGATGLLVLCVGPATAFVERLSAAHKSYRARFVVGEATDTVDADGEVTERRAPDAACAAALTAAVESLLGEHELAPPAYSAVRVKGVRAHEMARRGEAVELETRPMRVLKVGEVVRAEAPAPDVLAVEATLEVSKGTYIRSLATLLGERLGFPCRLDALERVGAGDMTLSDPRVIRGLVITERTPGIPPDPTKSGRAARGQKPRTRLGGGPEDLGLCLVGVSELLPLRLVEVKAPPGLAGLERLKMGQRLAWASPQAIGLRPADAQGPPSTWLVQGPVEPDGAHTLSLVEGCEARGERGPSIRPVRTLRMWPPGRVLAPQSSTQPAPRKP